MVGGGGLIQIPALFAVYPGVAPATLLGTSKFAGLFGTVSAVARYARKVVIPWRALLPLAFVALLMSLGGARLASIVKPDIFRPLVPIMLLAVLIYVLWRKDLGGEHAPRAFAGSHHIVGAVLIAAIGMYDGFFGPGTGSLLIFVFVRCYGYDFLHAGACGSRGQRRHERGGAFVFRGARPRALVRRRRDGRVQYRRCDRRRPPRVARRQRVRATGVHRDRQPADPADGVDCDSRLE